MDNARKFDIKFRDQKEDYGNGTMIEFRDRVCNEKTKEDTACVEVNTIRIGVRADKTYTKQARHQAAKDGLIQYLRQIADWLENENINQGQEGETPN